MSGEYLIAAALLLALFYGTRRRTPKLREGDRVYLFGDSLAQGLVSPLRKLLASRGIDLVADVQPGTRFDQWVSRGPNGAVPSGARFALISLGTNDSVANAAHLAQVPGWAQDISASLRSGGVTPVWLLPPPMRFSTRAAVDAVRATKDPVVEAKDYPRYDGIHPTPAGFETWAGDIVRALTLALDGRGRLVYAVGHGPILQQRPQVHVHARPQDPGRGVGVRRTGRGAAYHPGQ